MTDVPFLSPRFSGNAILRDVLNGRAVLKQGGISGVPVRLVQQALLDLGESMPSGADGQFGAQTHNAVVHYQQTRGLSADGIVGRSTMARIDSDIGHLDMYSNVSPFVSNTRTNLMSVALFGSSEQELRDMMLAEQFDFGCKPCIRPADDGSFVTFALVSPNQFADLRAQQRRLQLVFEQLDPERKASVTVGQGDRFNGGLIAPRGLGSRGGQPANLGGIMNVIEVSSAINGLVREYGVGTFPLRQTVEGVIGNGVQVGGGINPQNYHIYFTAGVHARERGGPDNLIYFISDLLYAQKHGTGLTYGSKTYSNADVLRALSAGIVFIPLVNPDGVRFDQLTDCFWRKNRNRASAIPGDVETIGVDINRNYDFCWKFKTFFNSLVWNKVASEDPASDTFHGTSAFSEVESDNVRSVFEKFPRVRWYMDIHSCARSIYYSWGNDENGDKPGQTFKDTAFDGMRGVMDGLVYREFISANDKTIVQTVAGRVSSAMSVVKGHSYPAQQSIGVRGESVASGASDDYAFSRSMVDPSKNKVYGFTMEFGVVENFYPTLAEFQENVLDTGAGLMEFCLAAADTGLN